LELIGQNVRHFRKLRGMTQAELAKYAGTTQYTVSEIELAHREPQPATLRKLAKALGVTVADFYGELDYPKGQPSLPLEKEPSLEEFYARAGCTTDWLRKPADAWYAAFRAKSRKEARDKVIRIARELEKEYLAIEPALFEAMAREKARNPENVWRRGTYHTLWQAALSRRIEVLEAAARADMDDSLPKPDGLTHEAGNGFLGKSNEELEEIRMKRSRQIKAEVPA
jgi:transcriptional regulator with XRE-family HTH domain